MAANSGVSRGEFAKNLAESGLLDLADVLPDPGHPAAGDGGAAARELVAAGRLTGYQASAVLDRRFADLRMGNYDILDRLGAGGMGTVYKARHRRMKRVVALKVLSKEVAGKAEFAHRFQREVETIARLSHPNIVMAYDADECDAGPFLVMEFVDGRDLATEVRDRGPLPAADAVDRVAQAARGLGYAHARGIIHRDIKPGNILRAADGVVKVADLGLARLNTPAAGTTALTEAGIIVGTADYMAPEQATGVADIDHRVDIYALGCTLFFLLTGGPPYHGPSAFAVLLKHRDAPIPVLAAPPELDAVFRRMVAKSPGDRYQSMAEVVRELEAVRLPAGPAAAAAPARPAGSSDPARTGVYDPAGGAAGDAGEFDLSPTGSPADTGPMAAVPAGWAVIVAEPSRTQAGIIRRFLGQLGVADVRAAGSGREALELAGRHGACVVIAALHLPDMTGTQLARAVLADPACARAGFILATSESDTGEAGDLPDSPRVVLVPKPFDLSRLARSLAAVVG
jgi:serine/threonine-protein kinase